MEDPWNLESKIKSDERKSGLPCESDDDEERYYVYYVETANTELWCRSALPKTRCAEYAFEAACGAEQTRGVENTSSFTIVGRYR